VSDPRVYVVDTDVISETTKPVPNRAAAAWLGDQASILLSAITIYELGRGIERVHGGKKRQFLEAWFVQLLDAAVEVLPFGVEAAILAAQLDSDARRRGRPIDTRDLSFWQARKHADSPSPRETSRTSEVTVSRCSTRSREAPRAEVDGLSERKESVS